MLLVQFQNKVLSSKNKPKCLSQAWIPLFKALLDFIFLTLTKSGEY